MLLSSENPINPAAICALELPEQQIFSSYATEGFRPGEKQPDTDYREDKPAELQTVKKRPPIPVFGYGVAADLTGIQMRNAQLAIDNGVFVATWNRRTGSLYRVMWPLIVSNRAGYLLTQFNRNKVVAADVVQFDRWRLRPSVQGAKNLLVTAMHSLIQTESIHNVHHPFMGAEMIVRVLSPIPAQLSGQLVDRVANFADLHERR